MLAVNPHAAVRATPMYALYSSPSDDLSSLERRIRRNLEALPSRSSRSSTTYVDNQLDHVQKLMRDFRDRQTGGNWLMGPSQRLDLSGLDLRHKQLDGLLFHHVDFRNTRFNHADLTNVHFVNNLMDHADFSDATLHHTQVRQSNLPDAIFSRSSIYKSRLENLQAPRSVFNGATIEDSQFINSELQDSQFKRTILRDVDFNGAGLSGVSFRDAVENRVRTINSRVGSFAKPFSYEGKWSMPQGWETTISKRELERAASRMMFFCCALPLIVVGGLAAYGIHKRNQHNPFQQAYNRPRY